MSHRLTAFFRPQSMVFVGATERSVWTRSALANLKTLAYPGRLHLVNRKGDTVMGQAAATSLRELGESADLALLMVPSDVLADTIPELSAAGIRNAVVLSAGFAEAGEEGRALQAQLARVARDHDVALLGPNCLGFVNFVDRAPVWTVGLRPSVVTEGRIAIVSQSGALAAQMSYFANWQGIALTYMVSTGNEAGVDVAQVIDYLVDDESTRAIALFLETVRDVDAFSKACRRALVAAKPIVVLKVGSSAVTARSAQAHTGSLVGDDRVFDAACHQLGLVRVHSLEDLIITTEVLARTGRLDDGGVGLISLSGGLCEIAADRAEAEGVALPALAEPTVDALSQVLPDFGTPHNPLDVTGGALLNPAMLEQSMQAMARDPQFALVLTVLDVASSPADDSKIGRQLLAGIGAAQATADRPSLLVSHTVRPFTELTQEIVLTTRCNYLPCGVHHALSAIGNALAWSRRFERSRDPEARSITASPHRPSSEQDVLQYLSERGVPVVPTRIVDSVVEAVAAARALQGPVALKIASVDIAHKTEVGGVMLNVQGDAHIAAAYGQILARVRAARPDARINGVAISPMRTGGTELFVGVMRDAQWGPVIAVGLGGIWVEALRDTSLRLLPVSTSDVLDMLDELRGKALLDGFRASPVVDREAVAAAVVAIGDAALALGASLRSLEINPLLVTGNRVEALDGLAEWF